MESIVGASFRTTVTTNRLRRLAPQNPLFIDAAHLNCMLGSSVARPVLRTPTARVLKTSVSLFIRITVTARALGVIFEEDQLVIKASLSSWQFHIPLEHLTDLSDQSQITSLIHYHLSPFFCTVRAHSIPSVPELSFGTIGRRCRKHRDEVLRPCTNHG